MEDDPKQPAICDHSLFVQELAPKVLVEYKVLGFDGGAEKIHLT